MSKFLHTWEWVVDDQYRGNPYAKENGGWRETFINLEAVNCFTVSVEVDGRKRVCVHYRGDLCVVIEHTIEQLQKLLDEPGHLIPHKLGKLEGGSHDEP